MARKVHELNPDALPKPTVATAAQPSVDVNDSDRGQWGNQIEFILACVGYAVGLGNVWRFPYLAYQNGGGVFLIPYTISLFVAGLPIFYLELCLGQYSSLGPNCIFGKLAPIFQGLGWGMITIAGLVSIYYNVIIAWILYYFAASIYGAFQPTMLWVGCLHYWNTIYCSSNLEDSRCATELKVKNGEAFFFNKTCYLSGAPIEAIANQTLNGTRVSPSEEFFSNYVLNKSDGIGDLGGLEWKMVLALVCAWIVIFLCLIKGVQSTGKVVYFTATFPYVVLVILLIRGLTLDGAGDGLVFYLKPDISKLWQITVWKAAAIQIFYSLGPAFGSLLTMASYNRFNNNCYRDATLVAIINCATSVLAGFAIFSTMGFMAKMLNVEVKDVIQNGPGLAFIAYPEAISRMPVSVVWALLFFFMLFTLGLDSQFAMVENVTTAVMDQFPQLRKYKSMVTLSCCFVMFLLGLPMCLRGGIYIFTLFDNYSAGYCLVLIAFLELIVVNYIYGIKNFFKDITLMIGHKQSAIARIIGPTGFYWTISWLVTAPLMLLLICIALFVFHTTSTYGKYNFPMGADLAGWGLSTLPVLWIPAFAIFNTIKFLKKGRPFSYLFKPTSEWCPAHERDEKDDVAAEKEVYTVIESYRLATAPTRQVDELEPAYKNGAFMAENEA